MRSTQRNDDSAVAVPAATVPAAPSPASAVPALAVPALADSAIETAMRRAIELSTNGPAWGVNPQVGCVILSPDGIVLAEGWHRGAGTPHAEVDALTKLGAASNAIGAIAVVTLEPCNHTGRTGPCSQALIAAGIGTVYFGASDPGQRSGGGASTLAEAGLSVHGGVLAAEVERSIHPWLTAERNGRPFVTVKWASSLDGRAAATDGTSQWITGMDARADVHLRRSRADAIAVGTGTLLADDPSLTARYSSPANFGGVGSTGGSAGVTGSSEVGVPAGVGGAAGAGGPGSVGDSASVGDAPSVTVMSEPVGLPSGDSVRAALYSHQPQPVVIGERRIDRGARVFEHPLPVIEYPTRNLHGVLADLFGRGVRSVFVEGGPTLASAFIRAGLADEIVAYLAPVLLGGPMLAVGSIGVDSIQDALPLTVVSIDLLGPDLRIVAEPRRVDTSSASSTRSTSPTSDPKEHHRVHRNH